MTTFKDLGVRDDLLKAVSELGFETPMPVQEKVIPHLLNEDNDVVALAQTGTGKTAAFGLPVIQRIDISQRRPQALILAPTRELCLQISPNMCRVCVCCLSTAGRAYRARYADSGKACRS